MIKIKIRKSSRPDEISYELTKNGGKELRKNLYNPVAIIWKEEVVSGLEERITDADI